jgi:RNA polymerase sigma-70 factor, ECF subfamily
VALVSVMVRPRAVGLDAWVAVAPLEEVADAELVARAQRGDRWAEEALFRKHVEHVAALSLRLLRDRTEADDVVQETFLDAFAQIRREAPTSLRAWLTGIAVHKAHRRFRRKRLLGLLGLHHSSHDAVLEAHARSGTSADIRAELGLLDAVLARVADADRAAWSLRYVEGYTLGEVAALCRCSLTTAKRRIQRVDAVVADHVQIARREGDDE